MKRTLLTIVAIVALILNAQATDKPRLVVNIVVPSLSASDLRPIEANLSEGGLRRLLRGGVSYPYAYYHFVPNTEAALAALTTGAGPELSGVVGPCWWNFTTGSRVGVVADSRSSSYDCDTEESRVSNVNLVTPTLGDQLRSTSPQSKSVVVATSPSSAIILGGTNPTEVWWIDSLGARWTTSTKYMAQLPQWVKNYNSDAEWRRNLARPWVLTRADDHYYATKSYEVRPQSYQYTKEEQRGRPKSSDLRKVGRSYVANDMVAGFVREAVIYNALGGDTQTDILTICFDAPARIAALYGTDSREWEDMIYRLDSSLSEMMNFISAQCDGKVVWTLSSDGGAQRVDSATARRFNAEQFLFLAGTYLNANYGKADWILGYDNCSLWLNREAVRAKGLNLEAVQRSLAQFALQYGGVSHAVVQADLVGGGVKQGVVGLLQSGFYPRRSADLVLVLMPGWVEVRGEEEPLPRQVGGSPYDAGRRALLAISGYGVPQEGEVLRKVDVTSLVPSLARIIGIDNPVAATAEPLVELF